MNRQNHGRGRGARGAAAILPAPVPWGGSCAFTVGLLLTAATPDRDGPVRNRISHRAVAVRLPESRARARAVDAHRSIFTV